MHVKKKKQIQMVTVLIVGTRNVAEEQKMKCNSLFVEHVSGCTDE